MTIAALDRTNHFLDALETQDLDVIVSLLDADVTWRALMSATGGLEVEQAEGLDAFGARLMEIGGLMQSAKFANRRITVSADGATSFVESTGDFVTADGRPYRNVYVFRFDWVDGKIVSWDEYANPVTIMRTFPEQYAHQLADVLPGV